MRFEIVIEIINRMISKEQYEVFTLQQRESKKSNFLGNLLCLNSLHYYIDIAKGL